MRYPHHMSEESQSLIKGLLDGNEHARLGSTPPLLDALKAHPFFEGIDWVKLSVRHMIPPWTPDVKPLLDSADFTSYADLEQAYEQQREQEGGHEGPGLDWSEGPSRADQKFFDNWDFVSLHTLKIEMGISKELDQHDSNFKVRQLMGDPGASMTSMADINSISTLRQLSSASARVNNKLRMSLGL